MGLLSTLKYIANHPLNRADKAAALLRFARWQLAVRASPYPLVYPFTDRAKLVIRRGMTGATGNIYCGFHEYSDMLFALHFLRPDDLFVDIGANIGSYTVLSAAHVGAETISVEPVPSTFQSLLQNIAVNGVQSRVSAHNLALGAKAGSLNFTSTEDTVNHVAVAGETQTISVPVDTLDHLLACVAKPPSLLKVDVEGFESEVFAGASTTLAQDGLAAIIVELNGSGARYGADDRAVHQRLLEAGFRPRLYDPARRKLAATESYGTHNTIYVKDEDRVLARLQSADEVSVLGHRI